MSFDRLIMSFLSKPFFKLWVLELRKYCQRLPRPPSKWFLRNQFIRAQNLWTDFDLIVIKDEKFSSHCVWDEFPSMPQWSYIKCTLTRAPLYWKCSLLYSPANDNIIIRILENVFFKFFNYIGKDLLFKSKYNWV